MPNAAMALLICSFSSAASAGRPGSHLRIGSSSADAEARCIQVIGPTFFLAQGFLLRAFLRRAMVFLLVLAQHCWRPGVSLLRQVAVVILDLAQDCWRLGLALQAALLRHRPCPCLPKGHPRLPRPRAAHCTPSRCRKTRPPAALRLDPPRSRLGPLGFHFPHGSCSARARRGVRREGGWLPNK